MIDSNYPAIIKKLRAKLKINQYELVERAGISIRRIAGFEQGITTPEPYEIRKLARALETRIDIFYDYTYEKIKRGRKSLPMDEEQ